MWLTAGVALAAVPALFGLTGNPALSHSVPVRVPSGAVPVTDTQIDNGRLHHESEGGSGREGSGKGHGATVTPPVAGRGGHGSPAPPPVAGKDRHGGRATTPGPSTIPHVATVTPQGPGKRGHGADDARTTPAAPTGQPTPGKARISPGAPNMTCVSPAAPDGRGRRPDPNSGSANGSRSNHGLNDGLNDGLNADRDDGLGQGGGGGRKLAF